MQIYGRSALPQVQTAAETSWPELPSRGELIGGCTDDDARRQAAYLAEHFGDIDAEDAEVFYAELAEA